MSRRAPAVILAFILFVLSALLVWYLRSVRVPVEFAARPVSFSALADWPDDSLGEAVHPLLVSCSALLKKPADTPLGELAFAGTIADWRAPCEGAASMSTGADEARQFFETWFTPLAIEGGGSEQGLFTGYFVPLVDGSLLRGDGYDIPLHARPPDLVSVDLGQFRPSLKGERIAGRVENGRLHPYVDRAAITTGALKKHKLELVWLKDPVDAFFMQVQGSGLIRLPKGDVIRVGYAGQNGHAYTSIGKVLVERGELALEEVSMQSIRSWLETHPNERDALLNTNASYVFFTRQSGDGAIGTQGVALTPGRSLAVDRQYIPLGVPVWLEAEPEDERETEQSLRRLLIAQDTGGAIRGAVRGDVFWGAGGEAGEIAGKMRHKGRYFVLVPKTAAARLGERKE